MFRYLRLWFYTSATEYTDHLRRLFAYSTQHERVLNTSSYARHITMAWYSYYIHWRHDAMTPQTTFFMTFQSRRSRMTSWVRSTSTFLTSVIMKMSWWFHTIFIVYTSPLNLAETHKITILSKYKMVNKIFAQGRFESNLCLSQVIGFTSYSRIIYDVQPSLYNFMYVASVILAVNQQVSQPWRRSWFSHAKGLTRPPGGQTKVCLW